MLTQYVQAYVRRNKTDAPDAAALLKAIRCCELRRRADVYVHSLLVNGARLALLAATPAAADLDPAAATY